MCESILIFSSQQLTVCSVFTPTTTCISAEATLQLDNEALDVMFETQQSDNKYNYNINLTLLML